MEGIPGTLAIAFLCEELVAMLGPRVPGDHRAASEVASVFLFTAQSEKCIVTRGGEGGTLDSCWPAVVCNAGGAHMPSRCIGSAVRNLSNRQWGGP